MLTTDHSSLLLLRKSLQRRVTASHDGVIAELLVKAEQAVEAKELLAAMD